MWMSQRLSPASTGALVGVHAGRNLMMNLRSVAVLQRSHDYLCSYAPHRPPTKKNAPNTRQSTTVIERLCFPIHVRKDSSMVEARCGTVAERPKSARTGMAKTSNTSPSAAMLPLGLRLDAIIRLRQATKIARFLICSGKSAIPTPNALGGDMEFIDSIHPGGDASGSGASSRLLRLRTISRAPTVALKTRPTVETALPAPPKRMSPETPITAQVAKYPSARAPALGRGLLEPRNKMVRRSKGGATEPPMARTRSPGRASLMNFPLAVVREMRNRTRRSCAGGWRRRTD